jgi:hypothetical protein
MQSVHHEVLTKKLPVSSKYGMFKEWNEPNFQKWTKGASYVCHDLKV